MSETTYNDGLPGEPVGEHEHVPTDYFGFASQERYYFPGQTEQWIEFAVMNEGAKARYQGKTQRDLVLERKSGNARMKVNPADERHMLITESVTGWNLYRGGRPVQFDKRSLGDFLSLADPRVIEGLEKAIRKANPWLLDEMKSEDIEEEIKNLQEMLEVARERERGEDSSVSK